MELIVVAAVLAVLLVVVGLLAAYVPMQRWRAEVLGRAVEVVNHVFHETVSIDGARVPGTRVDGDRLTWAAHEVELAPGQRLAIRMETSGLTVRCRMVLGKEVVFDSDDIVPREVAAEREPDDPRWAAVGVLLAEIRRSEKGSREVAPALASAEAALRTAFQRLASARAAAEAHAALGGDRAAADPLLAERERELEALLSAVRDLHLATASGAPPDLSQVLAQVNDARARLDAEREVRGDLARRARAAQRQ